MLEVEHQFLDSHRDELLRAYGDKFLVIHGDQVTGAFDSLAEALKGSVAKHGLESVLIRKPTEAQLEVSVPALALGLLNADPSCPDRGAGEDTRR